MKTLVILVISLFITCAAFPTPPGKAETFVLNTSYSPPHSSPDEQGILDRILKAAFARIGHEVHLQMLPAERCLRDSNAGIADGEVGRIRGMDKMYPNLVIVDEPIIESRDFVAFSIKYDFPTTSWETLKPYNIGIMKGWKILEKNIGEPKSLVKLDSTRDLIYLLKRDRIDIALNARIDGTYAAFQLGIQDDIHILEPPLASLELYLFMHKKHREMIPLLEKALAGMKADRSFHEIREEALLKWLSNR